MHTSHYVILMGYDKRQTWLSSAYRGAFTILLQLRCDSHVAKCLQVFGNSPDETAYCRLVLNKETASEALTAIQPMLMAYSFDQPVTPVLLDVSSIQPDRVLLLDSYFYVIVFHGTTIAQWRKAGYHNQEEHSSFRHLLQVNTCALRHYE